MLSRLHRTESPDVPKFWTPKVWKGNSNLAFNISSKPEDRMNNTKKFACCAGDFARALT